MKLPAPSRDPCFWCETPGFKGCAHWLPFEAPAIERGQDERLEPRHNIGGTTAAGVKPGAYRRKSETKFGRGGRVLGYGKWC